ncbi:MerR family transcriptional regulator [Aminipila terrae]|uniref:MerR family transcriptional regulator n=1 Tax=Aminipila terrae TaxID=2697030 RepID=A0A6P1MFG3_9FIRM|nr:MerR family transcriptional regulator [Aminipila terrae]QHI72647.1 MerR family transcriptional regulator [Aminipila terrae]
MEDLFTIGQIAKLFDINIRTLRYYDEINFLKPEYIEPDSKYRYYSIKQFEHLNTIKYLRELNMPLFKIKEFLDNREVDGLVTMLKGQQDELTHKKYELERIERKIHNRLSQIQDAMKSDFNEIKEQVISERKIAVLKKSISLGEDIEYPIAELGSTHLLNSAIFLGKVALSIEKDNLEMGKFDEFSSVIVIVEEEDQSGTSCSELAKGTYLTLRFQGTHKDAKKYYKKLLKYLKERNYKICGNAIEIALIDEGMTNDISQHVTEIQIPYKKD